MRKASSVTVLILCLSPVGLSTCLQRCLQQQQLSELLVVDCGLDSVSRRLVRELALSDQRVRLIQPLVRTPSAALHEAFLSSSSSDYITWFTSNVRLEPGALDHVVSFLQVHSGFNIVTGHDQYLDDKSHFLEFSLLDSLCQPPHALRHFADLCKPTVFMRTALLHDLGGFSSPWQYAFHRDICLRAFSQAPHLTRVLSQLLSSTLLVSPSQSTHAIHSFVIEELLLYQAQFGHVPDHYLASVAYALYDSPSFVLYSLNGFLSADPILKTRLQACLQGLQPVDLNTLDPSLPSELRLLLQSRQDLLSLGFHTLAKQRLFAQWLLLHGHKEYPSLIFQPAVLSWFGSASESASMPRIAQAIWDSTASHQRRWPLPKHAHRYQRWLKGRWARLSFEGLPPHSSFFQPGLRQRLLQRLTSAKQPIHPSAPLRPLELGVHLIGYANSALGIGEDVRTTAVALEYVDVGVSVESFSPADLTGRDLTPAGQSSSADCRYATSVLCLTAEETLRYVLSEGRSLLAGRYVIAYWPWELPHWPAAWLDALGLVDEVWASSRHIQLCLQAATSKPVLHMPLCVDSEALALQPLSTLQRREERLAWGFPEHAVLAICSFDWSSTSQRKNPWGAIQAFQRAFPPALVGACRSDVALVVKTFRPARPNPDWDRLQHLAALDPRIHLVEATLERDTLSALYGCCDVLLSLHRAEGFGRVLAEALQLGLDVIATQWSGNIDFCDGPLVHAVPFHLVEVPPAAYPHWHGQHWADPDLSVAARLLQQVVERRLRDGLPPMRWAKDYRARFSAQTCGQRYRARLEELGLLSAREENSGVVPR